MLRTTLTRAAAVACAIGLGGCDAADDDAGERPERMIGTISIVEYDGGTSSWAGVNARFEDRAAEPVDLVNDGSCRVFPRPCLGNVGACAEPPGIAVGTVEIRGLRQLLDLEPMWQDTYYGDVPADAFADDAVISASAAGGALDFALTATAVAPMRSELAGADLPPFGDAPVTYRWTPGDDGARVRLSLHLATFCHAGAEWLTLECESDDDGELTVPEEVLAALPPGHDGCGGSLARFRADRLDDGVDRVNLFVASADFFSFLELR